MAYPTTTLADFSELSREEKVAACARARLLLGRGNVPAETSVEGLIGGGKPDEYSRPEGGDREHIPKPNVTPPPADASMAQILLFMREQQRADREEAQAARAVDKEEARAARAAADAQIRLLADQLAAARHSTADSKSKFDLRFKRAKDMINPMLGPLPEQTKEIVKYFESAQRLFTLYSIDEDLRCPLVSSLLSHKAKQLLHRLPVDAIRTFDGLRANLLREFRLTPHFYCEQFATSTKYKSENFTQYATRVEVDFQLYLKSRKIRDGDYQKLRQLMIHDKFYQSVPTHLTDFATLCEMDGWVEAQPLAEKLDLYNCDRQVGSAYSHPGGGSPKSRRGGPFNSGGMSKANKPSGSNNEVKTTEATGRSPNSTP